MADDCCVECKQFIFPDLLGFVFVLPPKQSGRNFNNSHGWWSEWARARRHEHSTWVSVNWCCAFFCCCRVRVIFRLKCNSQNRIVCWWCAVCGDRVDAESAEKMDFIPFQYETISLYRICLTVHSVRSQKHFRNFVCTQTQKSSIARHSLYCECTYKTHFYEERREKNEYRSSNIDFVAIHSTAANVKLLFA